MNNLFVIEGQAGAGKTPLINLMKKILEEKSDYKVAVCAPFTFANNYIIENELVEKFPLGVYSCWGKSRESVFFAEKVISDHISDFISVNKGKLILFDRFWLTMCMSLKDSVLSENEKKEKIKIFINKNIPTFFLDTFEHITQGRQSWDEKLPWTNENIQYDFNLRRKYISEYKNMSGKKMVEKERIDLESVATEWCDKILKKCQE